MFTNRMWRLARRPVGDVTDDDLTWHEEPVGELADGEVVVATTYLSLDPTNRAWMNATPTYLPPVQLGEVMRGIGLGVVAASRHPGYPVGATVSGMLGWQSHAKVQADGLQLHDPAAPFTAEDYLGVLSHIGATAYFGVAEIAPPRAGETFVVSAAAGAVGSLAGQLARRAGARVVGIASTPDKCRWLTEELGFDAAIDRRAEDIGAALDRTCPRGIDVYFDNVGGAILDACLARINRHARIALCGMISEYTATRPPPGPRHFANLLVRRGRVEGFIVLDYTPRFGEAFAVLGPALRRGELRYRLDVVDGLDQAVAGLRRMFAGGNTGKLVVKV
jgi:NADPH-dependent curcumin reductase